MAEIVIYDNFVRGRMENLADALTDPRVRMFDLGGDILQTDILDAALDGADGVFHFAALWLLQCHEFPRSAFDVNIRGTFNVMEACVRKGVHRLVYSSSASVYGDAVQEPMTEDHPFNNKNFYGATKIAGEAMLRAFHHRYGLDYVGLRYMNVYGPRQDYQGAYIAVIMKMLDAIDRGEGPTILGDGSEAFDFVAVEDCARANVCAMKAETTDRFYNVGTGTRTSLKELAEAAADSHRLPAAHHVRAAQPGDAGAQPHRLSEARGRRDRLHGGHWPERRAQAAHRLAGEPQSGSRRHDGWRPAWSSEVSSMTQHPAAIRRIQISLPVDGRRGMAGHARAAGDRLADAGTQGRGVREGFRRAAWASSTRSRRPAARRRSI